MAKQRYVAQIAMRDDELGDISPGQVVSMDVERAAPLVAVGWLAEAPEAQKVRARARNDEQDSREDGDS